MSTTLLNILMVLLITSTLVIKSSTIMEARNVGESTLTVFEEGELETRMIMVEKSDSTDPPTSLLIVSPLIGGKYPLVLFFHGTAITNSMYSHVFQHIASHGFIVVAPQLYWIPIQSQAEEIEKAASVINWLPENIDIVLPQSVAGDLNKLTVSGHSRGGKTAFTLALNLQQTPLKLNISALIGVDPVAGSSRTDRTNPQILTYRPNSMDLSIPVLVTGSGLGNQSIIPFIESSCAPNGVNHDEFFSECRGECSHFVVDEYGHMDVLNDGAVLPRLLCVSGKGSKNNVRRTIGGLIVGFVGAYLMGNADDFDTILNDPMVAPAKLYPVEVKFEKQTLKFAQV